MPDFSQLRILSVKVLQPERLWGHRLRNFNDAEESVFYSLAEGRTSLELAKLFDLKPLCVAARLRIKASI